MGGTRAAIPDSKAVLPAWQCLALSLEVDPAELGMVSFLVLSARHLDMSRKDDPSWLLDMRKRWQQLSEALETDKAMRADKRTRGSDLDSLLVWGEFLEFAWRKRWKLPRGYRAAKKSRSKAKSAGPRKGAQAGT